MTTENDATPGGVSAPTKEPAFPEILPEAPGEAAADGERAPNPRMSKIEEMAAKLDAERMETADQPLEDEEPPAAGEELEPATEPIEPDLTSHLETPEGAAAASNEEHALAEHITTVDGVEMVRLKVDGEEKFVPLANVVATAQKNLAADERLAQAAERSRVLDEREATVLENERLYGKKIEDLSKREPTPPSSDAGDDDEKASALSEAKSIITSLFEGNEEDAAEGLAKVIVSRVSAEQTSLDSRAIATEAVQQAQEQLRRQEEQEKSNDELRARKKDFDVFAVEYADVVESKRGFALADAIADELVAEHPDWAPAKIMKESGDQVRSIFKAEKPKVEPASDDGNRRQRKEDLLPMPASRLGVRPSEKDDAPPTTKSVFDGIKNARGQA